VADGREIGMPFPLDSIDLTVGVRTLEVDLLSDRLVLCGGQILRAIFLHKNLKPPILSQVIDSLKRV
jgi:hypothetical protein